MPGLKDWIAKAITDLKSAKKLIKDDDDTLHGAAYFTQQAAEKSLKAYLVFKGQELKGLKIPKTHDLEKLLQNCMTLDISFGQLRSELERLSTYATYTRYPDDYFYMDRQEAEAAIKHAEKILKFVKAKIELAEKTPQMKIFAKD